MLLNAKLTRRFFAVIMLIIAAIILAFYIYSVPLIQKTVFEIELNASRIALNNVFELANKMHVGTEQYRRQTRASHKQRLQAVVSLAEAYVEDRFREVERGTLTRKQARTQVFAGLRNFTYGNNDYVWIANYDSVLLSHPDPEFHGTNVSTIRNEAGERVIPKIVAMAVAEGEGFYGYKWHRLNEQKAVDKLSYVKDFPQWGFVIGSGVYLDDIDREIRQQTQTALRELRAGLQEIKIAKTGYLYIFDSDGNMLAHPNPNIDKTNFSEKLNPVSGRPIFQDLMAVADSGRELRYRWDKPSDPGNYVHDKLSLVRYLPGFDWYIGSSVYVNELQNSSKVLTDRILTIASGALLAALILAFIFVNWITRPIRRLSHTAERVSAGDLSAKSGIRRDDELGVLARAFDGMVDQLRGNISTLDAKVQERTRALEKSNRQLRAAVSSMKQAQQELELVEERQRLILDALPAQVAYIDQNMRYVFVNRGYADMFCGSKEAIVGKPISEVIGQRMYDDIQAQVRRTLAGEESVYEYRFRLHDREMITKRILIPFRGADNRINGLLNLSLDITAEKEAERTLNEAQRMNAVGQLAGGLAHDFNNLLSILLGNLVAMRDSPALGEGLLRYLTPAIRATRRGADITRRLLAFSRRQPLQPTAVDLSVLIPDLVELLQSPMPSNIQISYRCESDLQQPFVDAGQLEDALVNLALNARDAMPQGGELRFLTSNRHVTEPLHYDETVTPGHYVEIQVRDSGTGFSAESADRAFEPFFTTKSGSTGSGLGLSMVYGFVKQSKGYISLHSEAGRGATITLLLPAAPEEQALPAPAALAGETEDASGKLVLLVEDEPDVRQVVREQLVTLGFTVIEAVDGDDAQQLIETLDTIHGMVSDIVMPGRMNGFELAKQLRQKQPDSRIILMSGYSYEQTQDGETERDVTMLRKPFEFDDLRAALRRAAVSKTV